MRKKRLHCKRKETKHRLAKRKATNMYSRLGYLLVREFGPHNMPNKKLNTLTHIANLNSTKNHSNNRSLTYTLIGHEMERSGEKKTPTTTTIFASTTLSLKKGKALTKESGL